MAEQADRCSGCGQPLSESTAKENELAYVAEAERCHACRTRVRFQRTWQEDGGDVAGLRTGVLRRDQHPEGR